MLKSPHPTGCGLCLTCRRRRKEADVPVNTWHADAGELSDAVQAGGVILARHGQTLVDVDLAARAGVASAALALEGALGVHALSKVLARVGTC